MNNIFQLKKFNGVAFLPSMLLACGIIGCLSLSIPLGFNLYEKALSKVSSIRVAQQLADNELDRIRAVEYDDVVKVERVSDSNLLGYYKEVMLGKEYREDIGNTVMKHKPVTVNIYASVDDSFPLVSVKTEKVSRWYKSGTFDNSNLGVYDETGEQHKGTIKKTGNGTGYVFLKKGAKVNGDVEIYDETNGDFYIYNSVGTASEKTVIRRIGSIGSSGYISLLPSCHISGIVTLENISNGGLIIERDLKNNTYIKKAGAGTGYLKIAKGKALAGKYEFYNDSAGPIILNGVVYSGAPIIRKGDSDSLLSLNGTVSGPLDLNLNGSGRVNLYDTMTPDTTVNYFCNTNKALNIYGCSKIKGNISVNNTSHGNVSLISCSMSDGAVLNVSGIGKGSLKIYSAGVVERKFNVINDTDGGIELSNVLHDGKTLKKLGGGIGILSLQDGIKMAGDFTFDYDGVGSFSVFRGWESITNSYRIPYLADGAYINFKGGSFSGGRLMRGVQVLGRVDIDTSANPYAYFSRGVYMNPYDKFADVIIADGAKFKL